MSADRKAWAREALAGVENVTLPSFDRQLRTLHEAGIRWDVRQAVAHGFRSTVCGMDAGLTPEEARRFVEIAVEEAAGRIAVGVAAPSDSFAQAEELLGHAERAGATHALLSFPSSFRPGSQDDVRDAFARVAGATGLAIVLPVVDTAGTVALHPSQIPLGAYEELAELPNVVGLHVRVFDSATLFEAFRRFGDRLVVGVGRPELLGAFSTMHRRFGAQWLAAAPWELWQSPDQRLVVEIHELVMARRADEARERYWRVAPAVGIAFGAGLLHAELAGMAHLPLAKFISWSVGGNGGLTRDPAMRLKDHEIGARMGMLGALGIPPDPDVAGFYAGRATVGAAA